MDKSHSSRKIYLLYLIFKVVREMKTSFLSVRRIGAKTESLQEEDTTDAALFQVVKTRWLN